MSTIKGQGGRIPPPPIYITLLLSLPDPPPFTITDAALSSAYLAMGRTTLESMDKSHTTADRGERAASDGEGGGGGRDKRRGI